MKKIYLIGLLCFVGSHWVLGQCPSVLKSEVDYNQTSSDRGTIRFFLQSGDGAASLSNAYKYNLWDKNIRGYLYSPSKLDPGFYEDERIEFSVKGSIVEFRNVPASGSYFLVVCSSECNKQLGPPSGVRMYNSER